MTNNYKDEIKIRTTFHVHLNLNYGGKNSHFFGFISPLLKRPEPSPPPTHYLNICFHGNHGNNRRYKRG